MILRNVIFVIFFCTLSFLACQAGQHNRVLLEKVKALTLHAGRMTTGRRTPPVPQLKCVGGSAGCSVPQPRLAQCINQGFDGASVQWECKSQLDAQYELGDIEVICEGYDYEDDPFILQGSCGLEYTLEHRKGYSGSGTKDSSTSYGWKSDLSRSQEKSSGFGDILFFACCCLIIYGLYRTCLAPSAEESYTQESTTDDDRPDDGMGPNPDMGWNIPGRGMGMGGPNMGFPGSGFIPRGDSCGARRRQRRSFWNNLGFGGGRGGGGGGGGFWTGLATGGMMGYMFGGNRNGYSRQAPRQSYTPSAPSDSSSFFSGGSGSTTHESTSFGGTRRR